MGRQPGDREHSIWLRARISGLAGWIEEGLAGLALGLMYLRTSKNLSVPIIAHGVCDTIDMVLIFFGRCGI